MTQKNKNSINNFPKFGIKVYSLLVENFPHTYLVGGCVRDFLLGKKSSDIDICTTANPQEVEKILINYHVPYNKPNINFGIITTKQSKCRVEISTLRKETYTTSRYPKITYIKSLKQDAKRRDFTINCLYLNLKTGKIIDYYNGIRDIKNQKIKFVGKPDKKIIQDPLRIIRALRFCLQLNFKLDFKTKFAVKNNFALVKNLTKNIIQKEIFKLKNTLHQKILQNAINSQKMLDNYF